MDLGNSNIRLLLVADDPLARNGLAALFVDQPDFSIVGQSDSDRDLWLELDVYQPDVLLCDLGWNPTLTLERISDLRESDIPLILLLPDPTDVPAAWAAGARGLLPRDVTIDKLLAALQAVVQGLAVLDPEFMTSLLPNFPAVPPPMVEDLTPRELEVLQHLAEGLPNKAIALHLEISEHTVKFHVNAIMGKLGAQSRTQAVVRATQLGLILL